MQQLRAQVPVLKKAVLDEQANEEQLKVETWFWTEIFFIVVYSWCCRRWHIYIIWYSRYCYV